MIIINSQKTIPIIPSSKFICKHKYPELRREIYQAVFNLFSNKQNVQYDEDDNSIFFNQPLPIINPKQFMQLEIHDLNL